MYILTKPQLIIRSSPNRRSIASRNIVEFLRGFRTLHGHPRGRLGVRGNIVNIYHRLRWAQPHRHGKIKARLNNTARYLEIVVRRSRYTIFRAIIGIICRIYSNDSPHRSSYLLIRPSHRQPVWRVRQPNISIIGIICS